MIKRTAIDAIKTLALMIAMIVGTALSGVFAQAIPHAAVPDGPIPVLAALVIVNGLGALAVAALSSRLALGGGAKAATLFVIVFALETGLSVIESAVFRQVLHLSWTMLCAILAAGAIRAAVTAAAATALWPRAEGTTTAPTRNAATMVLVIATYVLLYFAAGQAIAWRSAAVRDFYDSGRDIYLPALVAVQAGRGVLWYGLALLLASTLRGRGTTVAICVAFAFSVLMAAPLLYPNAIMPWPVRGVHLVELAVSNFAFGLSAIAMLRRGRSGTFRHAQHAQ